MNFATWTDEAKEKLRSLVEAGKSASQIADELGVSRNAVIGKALRSGFALHGQGAHSNQPWRKSDMVVIAAAIEGRISVEGAAKAIQRSEKAVRRKMEKVRDKDRRARAPKEPKEPSAPAPREPRGRPRNHILPPAPIVEPDPPPSDGPLLMELRHGHCRFPMWRGPADYRTSRYCGGEAREGTSWCAYHARAAVQTPRGKV